MRPQTGIVRGLTTAAGLWATAGIGIVMGTGEYFMAASLAALVMLILIWERLPFTRKIDFSQNTQARETFNH